MILWLIITVIHTTWAVVKLKPEKNSGLKFFFRINEYLTTWKQCKVSHQGKNFTLFSSCRCSFILFCYYEKKTLLGRQILRQVWTDREDMHGALMISMHAGLYKCRSSYKGPLDCTARLWYGWTKWWMSIDGYRWNNCRGVSPAVE